MDLPEGPQSSTPRGCLLTLGLIMVGIFALIVLTNAAFDHQCRTGAENWLPAYPGSEVISEDYTFLQMWGIGTSQQVLFSEDDVDTVDDWYRAWNRQQAAEGASRGGARMVWDVDEADNGGTTIVLFSQCAESLDLSPLGIGNAG